MQDWGDRGLALAPVTGAERTAAAFAHAGVFLCMPFVLPFGVWLLFSMGQQSAYVRHQAVQAMLFHLIVSIAFTVFGTIFMVAFFGTLVASLLTEQFMQWLQMVWPVTLAVGLGCGVFIVWSTIVMVVAILKAAQGQPYRMPLVGGFGID